MNDTPLQKVLTAVGDYKRSPDGFRARCPAHEDRSPSLSIRAAEDGTVLLKCHAGCSAQAVTAALGLTMADLFLRVDAGITPRQPTKNGVPSTAKPRTYPTAAAATPGRGHSQKGVMPGWNDEPVIRSPSGRRYIHGRMRACVHCSGRCNRRRLFVTVLTIARCRLEAAIGQSACFAGTAMTGSPARSTPAPRTITSARPVRVSFFGSTRRPSSMPT